MVSVHPRIVNDYNVVTRSLWLASHVEGEVPKLFQDAFHIVLLFFHVNLSQIQM